MSDPFEGLRKRTEAFQQRALADAERYAALDWDECQLCEAYGQDKRSLWISCLYAICEYVPEAINLQHVSPKPERGRGYVINLCKSCRGRLLGHLGQWREECLAMRGVEKDHDGSPEERDPERNIPVREAGRTIWMTTEEYAEYAPGREPVRVHGRTIFLAEEQIERCPGLGDITD